jgi:hypothetical protein
VIAASVETKGKCPSNGALMRGGRHEGKVLLLEEMKTAPCGNDLDEVCHSLKEIFK